MPYGVDDLVWDELLAAAIDELEAVATRRETVTYGELSRRLHRQVPAVRLDPHYEAMPDLLEQVNMVLASRDPNAPMLSALVVGAETNQPGGGFFQAAQDLGHTVGDRLTFWLGQVEACHAWARSRRPPTGARREA